MNQFLGISLVLLCIATSSHAGLYKWIDENGRVQYSDTPIAPESADVEQLETDQIDLIGSPAATSDNAGDGGDAAFVGRWTWRNDDGYELREFGADGSFRSSGEDQFGRTEGKGSWKAEINGERTVIVVTAVYNNTFKSGETVKAAINSRYTVKRIDDREMVLADDGYESTWRR